MTLTRNQMFLADECTRASRTPKLGPALTIGSTLAIQSMPGHTLPWLQKSRPQELATWAFRELLCLPPHLASAMDPKPHNPTTKHTLSPRIHLSDPFCVETSGMRLFLHLEGSNNDDDDV